MTEVHGHADDRFSAVSDALAKNLADGVEVGASIVVNIDGEDVVDIWGGHRDAARTQPWTEDTIVTVWSSTKTVTSLAALMLVDRGLLDPYERVARYWPEFAANGKDAVEVRHLLSHTSGVSAWEQPFAAEDSFDLVASTAKLAAQPPWWEPGTASGYHASNFGHLIGELVRRVSGRSLTDFVAAEIAGPAGADFRLGARPADHGRIATMLAPTAAPPVDLPTPDPDSVFVKTLMGSFQDPALANTPRWLAAENGACNGHGNARSLARIVSALALGGVTGGVRLLHPETIELIFDEQAHGVDLFLGIPLRWGIGYALPEPEGTPFVPAGKVCFWGGWGGSLIIADVERRMTISYMMNQMQPGIIGSAVSAAYCDVITACAAGA
ncbi:serine hydrolase domain-containing protein [Cryptosporangium japonicum]|uniref:EstA family serine hydrolase n=1 Tax=Cryptosporangium japonicum TaxID=80872 RepID=A0ABP3DW82_9ACTN